MCKSPYSVPESFAGVLYQIKYALYLLLHNILLGREDIQLSLERLDDIEIRMSGSHQLIQTKNTESRLSNASVDLWKTIRIWSDHIISGRVDPNTTLFFLVSTASASSGHACYYLGQDNRNPSEALNCLNRTMVSSQSEKTLPPLFAVFKSLSDNQKIRLLENIYVIPESPNFTEIDHKIEVKLCLSAPPGKIKQYTERSIALWYRIAEECFRTPGKYITSDQLLLMLEDIRKSLQESNLPLDFENFIPPHNDLDCLDESNMIKQLEIIRYHGLKQFAKIDFIRARNQFSKWLRDELLLDIRYHDYEHRLQSEYETIALTKHAGVNENSSEAEFVRIGAECHDWINDKAITREDLRIVKNCSAPFILRGTYYSLSNDLKIGWHPRWRSLLGVSDEEME